MFTALLGDITRVGTSICVKKCETVVGCGVSCLQERNENKKTFCLGHFGDHQKNRTQRLVLILERKKLRDAQAGPRFRMLKKRQAANNDINNIASDTRGERCAESCVGW